MDLVVLIAMLGVGFLLGFYVRDRIDAKRYASIRRDMKPKAKRLLAVTGDLISEIIRKTRAVVRSFRQ
jgi:membrane carboxypeptidase/penicillin-binding protein